MKSELEDAPLFALHAAEREVRMRLSRDNALIAQLRKELRRRERLSRASTGDKTSTSA